MQTLPPLAQEVLDFWFGREDAIRDVWFRKDAAFDAQIAQRFAPAVEQAVNGELLEWQQHTDSALARIVLLDQFTRNIYRASARAFSGDALALSGAKAMVALGHDRALPPVRRAFVYLPFEHAEDVAAQDEAVRLFSALAHEAPALQGMLDYALRHREIIARFGRFPHRNMLVQRESTAEEAAFLLQPGSGF